MPVISQKLPSILLLAWLAGRLVVPYRLVQGLLDVGRSLRRRAGDIEPMREVLMGRREGPLSSMRGAQSPLGS
jgi:hypothetical protein